jgi:hypothetical protein
MSSQGSLAHLPRQSTGLVYLNSTPRAAKITRWPALPPYPACESASHECRPHLIAMLETIEEQAEICVARACGFAALGIATLMVGLSWDMVLASKIGGLLILAACMILLLKAHRAPHRPVRRTELWMTLEPDVRPNAAIAQRVVGAVLRECYLRCPACGALAAATLTLSLGLHVTPGASSLGSRCPHLNGEPNLIRKACLRRGPGGAS